MTGAMQTLRNAARRIRHLPGLSGREGVWSALRRPYQWLLDPLGRGVGVRVGGSVPARLPAEYLGSDIESYEKECVAVFAEWLRGCPKALFLDVGSALGFYSLAALASRSDARVVAFDSDLASLRATQRVCRFHDGGRLKAVHGFVSNENKSGLSLDAAVPRTAAAIAASGVTGDPGTTAYKCIVDGVEGIPTHSLDGLFPEGLHGAPAFVKCDVEGAELLVLEGARRILERDRPHLLVSVHPEALPQYGRTAADVRAFLEARGYRIRVIAVDYEEHWWCEPADER